jgi:hypothetical protein
MLVRTYLFLFPTAILKNSI